MISASGGALVAHLLAREGVEVVFGIIDGTYFGLYASLREYGIRLITPRHETGAVHMAGAYARMTGKLGVCIASNGPGVANALPGIAVENGEGNRVLLVTSARRTGIIRPDRGGAYQYFDQVAVTRPMTKWSVGVSSHARIPELMRRAFRLSFRGRPGVVHIDIPEDLMNGKSKWPDGVVLPPERYRRCEPIVPSFEQVARAAALLAESPSPLIHAGSGVLHSGASEGLLRVAELLRAPVTTSWAARGVMSESSDLSVPMIYVPLNNEVRNDADTVLALGTRFGETDWWGKPPYWRAPSQQRLIQVDVDEEILGLNKPVDVAVLADAKTFLDELEKALSLRDLSVHKARREAAISKLVAAKRKARADLDKKRAQTTVGLNPAHVAAVCQEVFDDDAVMVVDGGNTAIWANFYHEVRKPGTMLSTFKFGMLGAGISQALGAKVARPQSQVYCIIGDGAMGFHPQELETAVRNQLAVTYIVLCDKQWGMVKMNQQFTLKPFKTLLRKSLGPGETINADLGEIQFDKLAESMGAHGERVGSVDDLRPALERCLRAKTCSVVHVDVDPVAHMWAPSLKHFKDMHLEPKG